MTTRPDLDEMTDKLEDFLQVLPYTQAALLDEIAGRQRQAKLRDLHGPMESDWLHEQSDAEAEGRQSIIGDRHGSYADRLVGAVLAERMTCTDALASIRVQQATALENCKAIMAGDTEHRQNIGWYRGRLSMLDWLEALFTAPTLMTPADDEGAGCVPETVLEGVGVDG